MFPIKYWNRKHLILLALNQECRMYVDMVFKKAVATDIKVNLPLLSIALHLTVTVRDFCQSYIKIAHFKRRFTSERQLHMPVLLKQITYAYHTRLCYKHLHTLNPSLDNLSSTLPRHIFLWLYVVLFFIKHY